MHEIPAVTWIGVGLFAAYPLLVIAYDVWLIALGLPPISTAVLRLWGKYPIIAAVQGMGIGALLAHLGWSQASRGGVLTPDTVATEPEGGPARPSRENED